MDNGSQRLAHGVNTRKKRAAQACDNCRRKKSRCPGEMPQCSLCTRLRQQCVYTYKQTRKSRSRGPSEMHLLREEGVTRLNAIEERLEQLTAALGASSGSGAVSGDVNAYSQTNESTYDIGAQGIDLSRQIDSTDDNSVRTATGQDLPRDMAVEAIFCYFRHLDCQPYPLLSELGGRDLPEPEDLSQVVLDALLCLALPLLQHPTVSSARETQALCEARADSVWTILTNRYMAFQFDDTYFQGLCLLAQADFARGRTERAQTQVTLGLRLAQVLGMLDVQTVVEIPTSRSAIVWTLFMMDRIMGTGRRLSLTSSTIYRVPVYQAGPSRPDPAVSGSKPFMLSDTIASRSYRPSGSVIAVLIELLDLWGHIISHIFQTPQPEAVPFWQRDSPRAELSTRLLEFELKVRLHSYASTGPPTRILKEPHLRKYYSARFYLHLVHTGALCCLNHPFIIFTSTQHLKGHVPLSFLQNSYKISTINSNWVVLLITDMERSRVSLHDPFIGYLVIIAATIQLDRSLSKTSDNTKVAEQNFQRCHEFVRKMARQWPSMKNALHLLDDLHARLKHGRTLSFSEADYDGRVRGDEVGEVSLPGEVVQLMWSLFDYAAVSGQNPDQLANVDQAASGISTTSADPTDAPASIDGHGISWEDMPNFDDIPAPEDDWLLFGEPWTAYYPMQAGE